jgi:microcystin-dependent protein
MATAYTSDRKIGALESASTPLGAANQLVIEQNGDTVKTPLSAIEAKVFDAKTPATTTPTGTEVVVIRRTDNTISQVALSDIVPALNITNAKVSASAAIVDTKLATIATAGKVSNSATTATSVNTNSAIVARDGSGNFSAGTITATLAGSATGNAGTATTLQTARTIAISGDVTGTATSFNGSANITIPAAITADSIVNADINSAAGITDGKLATIATAGKVSNSATTATSANTINAIVARDGSGNFSAGTITATLTGNVTGNVTGSAGTLATGRTIALTGDVTGTTGTFNGSANVSAATTIANAAVTTAKIADANVTTAKIADANVTAGKIAADAVDDTKLRNSAALSVIGRSANSTGDPADIAVATDGHVLRRSGTTLGFGQIATAGITDAAVTTAKIADSNVTLTKLVAAVQQSLMPVGAVQAFAMNSAPSGWYPCNGDAVLRTGTYAALFAAIGITYGGGNGTTTFNVPDLRGIFVRGSGAQTISGTTYNKTFAAKEGDAIRNIQGTLTIQNAAIGSLTGAFSNNGNSTQFGGGNFNSGSWPTLAFNAANVVPTADENRPANIALLYCIKF